MWGYMRKLAIGAVVSGALALGGLAAPAAQAAAPALTFTKVTVNKGKPIVVGTTAKVKVPVTYTLTRPADLTIDYKSNFAGVMLYRGSLKEQENSIEPDAAPVCTTTATTATTVTQSCKETLVVDPWESLYDSADAGTWKAGGFFGHLDQELDECDDHISVEYGFSLWGGLGTAKVQRAAKLTVNASPEPARAGKTLTVKGKLTRANWGSGTYTGYRGQKVTLQFKAKGTSTYKAVKTVTTGTGGALSTTTKATKSGAYRFVFAGTSTTAAKSAVGDSVVVK